MRKDKMLQLVDNLKEYQGTKNDVAIDNAIGLIQSDIELCNNKWNKTLEEVAKIISYYQPIALNHNCQLKYSVFSIADTNYLDIYLNKKGYKYTVLEVSENSKSNTEIKLARILEEELDTLASKIDKLIN